MQYLRNFFQRPHDETHFTILVCIYFAGPLFSFVYFTYTAKMFKRNGENNFIHSREIIARLILRLNATKYANLLTFKIRHMIKKKKTHIFEGRKKLSKLLKLTKTRFICNGIIARSKLLKIHYAIEIIIKAIKMPKEIIVKSTRINRNQVYDCIITRNMEIGNFQCSRQTNYHFRF